MSWSTCLLAQGDLVGENWKEICNTQAKVEKSKQSYLVAIENIQKQINQKKVSKTEIAKIKKQLNELESLIIDVDKLINYKEGVDQKKLKRIKELLGVIRIRLLELHKVKGIDGSVETFCENEVSELEQLMNSIQNKTEEFSWKNEELIRKKEFATLGLDQDFLNKEKCFELIGIKVERYKDEGLIKEEEEKPIKVNVSGLFVNTSKEKSESKENKPISEKKKKAQGKVIEDAQRALSLAEKNKNHLPRDFKLIEFEMKADDAFSENEFSEKEKKKMLALLDSNIEKYKKELSKIKDPNEKIKEAVELFYQDYLHDYEPNNGQMKNLLGSEGGNCDTRAIFLYHALAQKLKLSPGENAQYAVEVFDQHVQLVIYKKDPKTHAEEVTDLLTGKSKPKADAPIFTDALLVKMLLVGQKIDQPDSIVKYQIAGPVINFNEKKPSSKLDLQTNSPRKLPSVGVKFDGSMESNKNSLSPAQREKLDKELKAAGIDIENDGSYIKDKEIKFPISGNFMIGKELIKHVKTSNEKVLYFGWNIFDDGVIEFDTQNELLNFLALKSNEERMSFLIDLDIKQIQKALASTYYQSERAFLSDPESYDLDQLISKRLWDFYYELSVSSLTNNDAKFEEEFHKKMKQSGNLEMLLDFSKKTSTAIERIKRNPELLLNNLNNNLSEDGVDTKFTVFEFLSQMNFDLNKKAEGFTTRLGNNKFFTEDSKVISENFLEKIKFQKVTKKIPLIREFTTQSLKEKQQEKNIEFDPVLVVNLSYRISSKEIKDKVFSQWSSSESDRVVDYLKSRSHLKSSNVINFIFSFLNHAVDSIVKSRSKNELIFPGPKGSVPRDIALIFYEILSTPKFGQTNFWPEGYDNKTFGQEYFDKLADSLHLPRKKLSQAK